MNILLNIFIVIPIITGIILYFLPEKVKIYKSVLFILAVSVNCFYSIYFYGKEILFNSTLLFKLDLYFRYYGLSSFMILILALAALLSAVYMVAFMQKDKKTFIFYAFMLFALAFTNGVLLTDNFIVFLLFWEALMLPMFAMIAVGKDKAFLTAIKTLIISSVADLCLMFGVMLICAIGGSFVISQVKVDINQSGALFAFIMLFTGAAAKAGAMPFHSWIPDAAEKAPLPFMIFIVTAVEKILSIYLLIRIVKDLFVIEAGSHVIAYAMSFGVITLLLASMLSLYQKDFKKMLSYASIAQAGYMIVAVSSATFFGLAAALFHMAAHILYKSGLFFVAGNIEKAEETTDMNLIKGNLRQSMPYTFLSFILAGSSFAGVPLFFAFFSKEMIYESAISVSWIFYACLAAGSLLSAVVIINWGRILFFSKPKEKIIQEKESPTFMFVPTVITAVACLLLGIFHKIPQAFITSAIGIHFDGGHSSSVSVLLVVVSVSVLIFAFINNLYMNKKNGKNLGIVLSALNYLRVGKLNENVKFDPYEIFISIVNKFANVMFIVDKGLNYFYDQIIPLCVNFISVSVKKAHNGNLSNYILWVLFGILFIFIIF